ncbi:MAG: PBP1A family penicillin-binding protein [Candidatus Eiseniibacteriota bacterium]|nr:MAG: PBP1A family penicillin-binding protein [Candidatus Eisenbacteria bacterium]
MEVTRTRGFYTRYGFSLLIATLFLLAGVLFSASRWASKGLPSPEKLQTIEPAVKTEVYDINGEIIHEFFKENRSLVPLQRVPQHLIDGIIVVEDRQFRSHWGIDIFGICRAAMKNVFAGRVRQGGSTITMQLARNLFLTHERTMRRKVKEAVLALRIERMYSKDEILEMYLNQIYFGEGAYGVQAASRIFFAKDVDELKLPECALLAGLLRNPGEYSPRHHPEGALKRRNLVLNLMLEEILIGQDEHEAALEAPLGVTASKSRANYAPYFVELVRQYLSERYGTNQIYEGGLKVYTTLDLQLQKVAEELFEVHLCELEKMRKYPQQHCPQESQAQQAPDGENFTAYVQGAMIALDARKGYVKAMIGGRDFEDSPFNRAVQAKRQPGSAFKPFVFVAAIDNGFNPCDIVIDEPVTFVGGDGKDWSPQNYDLDFKGPMTLRYALQQSVNVPAVKLLRTLGPTTVAAYARRMGLRSRIENVLSIALGTSEVTLLELTSAFGVLANQGIRAEPIMVLKVTDKQGRVLERNATHTEEALNEQTCYLVTSMMRSVVDHGTAFGARARGFYAPAGGKTGTTDDFTDAWFVGFTPELTVGVWVGFDKKKTLGPAMTGTRVALPIWTDIMLDASKLYEFTDFPRPPDVIDVEICTESGLLALDGCPKRSMEVFRSGEQPGEFCYLHALGSTRGDFIGEPKLRRPGRQPHERTKQL